MGFQPHAELSSDIIYNIILLYMFQYLDFLNAWTNVYDTDLLIRWMWTPTATIIHQNHHIKTSTDCVSVPPEPGFRRHTFPLMLVWCESLLTHVGRVFSQMKRGPYRNCVEGKGKTCWSSPTHLFIVLMSNKLNTSSMMMESDRLEPIQGELWAPVVDGCR